MYAKISRPMAVTPLSATSERPQGSDIRLGIDILPNLRVEAFEFEQVMLTRCIIVVHRHEGWRDGRGRRGAS